MKTLSAKIKISALVVLGIAALLTAIYSFKSTPASSQYMQVTTIESIVPGGLGRSRMLIVYPDGKNETKDLKNLYSLVGINFGNITENIQGITDEINNLTQQGWSLVYVTSNSQSPGSSNDGIFMTRYLFQKSN